MKKIFIFPAVLVFALVFGTAFLSCSTDADSSESVTGGKLTITDIPAAAKGSYIGGWASIPGPKSLFFTSKAPSIYEEATISGVLITGDTVTLNVYLLDIDEEHPVLYAPYTGSDTTTGLPGLLMFQNETTTIHYATYPPQYTWVGIYNEAVNFTDGSATISYSKFSDYETP